MTSLIKSEQFPYQIIRFFSPWTQAVYIQILRQQKEYSQSKTYSRKHPDPKPPYAEILELLYINLTQNDFEFNGQYYLQTKGTAMGKRFAPAYANTYMAAWEEQVLQTVPQKTTHLWTLVIWHGWSALKATVLESNTC